MAFAADAGWTQLGNGKWSPTIYSKAVQKAFRKSSTAEAVTNTDYFGSIESYGDSVRIVKEPQMSIKTLERGTQVVTEDIVDQDFSMIIDQAQYFSFALDDIEEALTHINWLDLASDNAGYKLRDHFDQAVLGYMSGWEKVGGMWQRRTTSLGDKADAGAGADELFAANQLDITSFGGTDLGGLGEVTSIPVAPGGGAGAITSPLAILNRISRKMDEANVDTEGRFVVMSPIMVEMLMDEDAKLVNADYGGGDEIRNGRLPNKIRGFQIYKSNNLPYSGNGADVSSASGSEEDFDVMLAGHMSSTATAQKVSKVESFRSPDQFADVVRGMQLWGQKILRPECLFRVNYNVA